MVADDVAQVNHSDLMLQNIPVQRILVLSKSFTIISDTTFVLLYFTSISIAYTCSGFHMQFVL